MLVPSCLEFYLQSLTIEKLTAGLEPKWDILIHCSLRSPYQTVLLKNEPAFSVAPRVFSKTQHFQFQTGTQNQTSEKMQLAAISRRISPSIERVLCARHGKKCLLQTEQNMKGWSFGSDSGSCKTPSM